MYNVFLALEKGEPNVVHLFLFAIFFLNRKMKQNAKKQRPEGEPAIEKYPRPDRKRTENVKHSLPFFLGQELHLWTQIPYQIGSDMLTVSA